MPIPATPILDALNRANENPLSGGGNWAQSPTSSTPQLQLISNQATGITVGASNESYWTPSTFGPDSECYFTVPVLMAAGNYVRLHHRVVNPASTSVRRGYMMQWENAANGCRIFKETATSAFTQLALAAAARIVAGDQIVFRAVGNVISVYQNGSLVLSVTDSSFTAGGSLIFGCRDTTVRLDDLGGGTIPSTSIKTIMGVAYPSNVKTVEGLAQASVKTVDGLA